MSSHNYHSSHFQEEQDISAHGERRDETAAEGGDQEQTMQGITQQQNQLQSSSDE